MTIGYYTDNSVSQGVMKAFSRGGVPVRHIKDFDPFNDVNPIFYGILRGTGAAMRHLQFLGENFHYLDNGYFDAIYRDQQRKKDMSGKYRIVKNDMIEPINLPPTDAKFGKMKVLIIPPSAYTAFMYDTTPEDWTMEWVKAANNNSHAWTVREKEDPTSLVSALEEHDTVLAFNSISVMKAIEMKLSVFTTHGVIRNSHLFGECKPHYNLDDMREFYETKQFTLEQIEELGTGCLN